MLDSTANKKNRATRKHLWSDSSLSNPKFTSWLCSNNCSSFWLLEEKFIQMEQKPKNELNINWWGGGGGSCDQQLFPFMMVLFHLLL